MRMVGGWNRSMVVFVGISSVRPLNYANRVLVVIVINTAAVVACSQN
jgi:hypothetical protein